MTGSVSKACLSFLLSRVVNDSPSWELLLQNLANLAKILKVKPECSRGIAAVSSLTSCRGVTYFKRYRMEFELFDPPPLPVLPAGFTWVAWTDDLLEAHAEVLACSFHEEIDAQVFPSLSSRRGCLQLMAAIRARSGFRPEATWLVACGEQAVGSVQGVCDRVVGAIQNLGVVPAYRGHGLGRALLLQALHGFRHAGLGRALLEVTAQNQTAVQLYHGLGFRRRKTVYKAVEAQLFKS